MVTAFGNIYSVPNYVLDHSESDAGRQDRISTKTSAVLSFPGKAGFGVEIRSSTLQGPSVRTLASFAGFAALQFQTLNPMFSNPAWPETTESRNQPENQQGSSLEL